MIEKMYQDPNISARVIEDSITQYCRRVTTLVLRYPRIIHSEFMTHRVFSRNAASSRAIPIKKVLAQVMETPFIPFHLGKNQKGMQAAEQVDEHTRLAAIHQWLQARDEAVHVAEKMADMGIHKQVVNRLVEPFVYIETVVTATEWDNALNLRDHPAAEPHIQELFQKLADALNGSRPTLLKDGEWHLPFVQEQEKEAWCMQDLLKFSVARCARVSYMTHEGKVDHARDMERHDDLLAQGHVSPFEHQATPARHDKWSGNLLGWVQYRKTLPGENRGFYPGLKRHEW